MNAVRYFAVIKDLKDSSNGDDGLTVPMRSPDHAQRLFSFLVAEANHTEANHSAESWQDIHLLPVTELELVASKILDLVFRKQAVWLDGLIEHREANPSDLTPRRVGKIFEYVSAMRGAKKNVPSEALKQLFLAAPSAPEILETLLDTEGLSKFEGASISQVIATLGLLFIDLYMSDYDYEDEAVQGRCIDPELHLQQAAESLQIAAVRRTGEVGKLLRIDQSRRAARRKDLQRYAPLRKLTIESYGARNDWKSTRAAARIITPIIQEFAKANDLYLSADRAQTTVYEWLLMHVRTVGIAK